MFEILKENKEFLNKETEKLKDSNEIYDILLKKGLYIKSKDNFFQVMMIIILNKIIKYKWRKIWLKNIIPLHIAVKNKSTKIFEILIRKGADIKTEDIFWEIIMIKQIFIMESKRWRKFNKTNRTPLHYAAENNSVEIGDILISKGADVNAKDIIYQVLKILLINNIVLNR